MPRPITEIADWVLAQIAVDAKIAQDALDAAPVHRYFQGTVVTEAVELARAETAHPLALTHILHHRPEHVLVSCEHRSDLVAHLAGAESPCQDQWTITALRIMASCYATRRGFHPRWYIPPSSETV